jgi:carbon storage regulator
MLVLTSKLGERVYIANDIVVTVLDVRGDRIRLGFDCPAQTPVHREEIYHRIQEAQLTAAPISVPGESQYHVEFA